MWEGFISKVIVRIKGGIGNQLFTYSIARYISIKNNAELVIDDISGFSRDYVFNRSYQLDNFNINARMATKAERLEPLPRFRRKLLKWYNYFLPFQRRMFIYQENIEFDERMLTLKFKKRIFLEGYWQSERYFNDINNIIKKDLDITPPKDILNLSLAKSISECNSVAVHVRFFDPSSEKAASNVSESYYRKAIGEIRNRAKVEHFFIFSDNPELARKLLTLGVDESTFITHNKGDENSYADMWLMTKCKYFIIANSTFSWWGAWLSNYPGKVVIAPKTKTKYNGMLSWGFEGLLPHEWIKI